MMNSRLTQLKNSTYDELIQKYLLFNIGLQIVLCSVLATCFVLWLDKHPMYSFIDPSRDGKKTLNWFLGFMSWMLLMT